VKYKLTYSMMDVMLADPDKPMKAAARIRQLTYERLIELLTYDPETGIFLWRDKKNSRRSSNVAGSLNLSGYQQIQIDKKIYLAHRLAWLYVYKRLPEMEIDHINGNPSDNRIVNLRDVSSRVNKENRKKARSDNVGGLLGAFKIGNKWKSSIGVNGKQIHLGYFLTAEDANNAYLEAKKSRHEGYVNP
jgi:hypothetical protein